MVFVLWLEPPQNYHGCPGGGYGGQGRDLPAGEALLTPTPPHEGGIEHRHEGDVGDEDENPDEVRHGLTGSMGRMGR